MAFWDKLGTSGSVDDRRNNSPSGMFAISSKTGLIIVIAIAALGFFGVQLNPQLVELALQLANAGTPTQSQSSPPPDDGYKQFASEVIGSTDSYWSSQFKSMNRSYTKPTLVLFRSATPSGCGVATSDVGPHYCPADKTIYLDETFFDVLSKQLGGSNGDVAQAYVIAHEVGHNVQNQLGAMSAMKPTSGQNSQSVKLELQADCYAGLWASSLKDKGVFENDQEINEAISAAGAVGDDRIQKKTEGQVNPETWTHGSAEERTNAFKSGFTSGKFAVCQSL